MTTKSQVMMVTLDSLFDTRIGTLAKIDVDAAAGFLHDESYAERLWDIFPGIDPVHFDEEYKKRDRETLRNSQTTPVVYIIQDFVKRCAESSYSRPTMLVPEIHINFYPYNLTEEEKDVIISGLQRVVPLKPEFKKVYFSDEQLNPSFCRTTYNVMVHYHGHQWLEMHSANQLLNEFKCEMVTLFVPAKLDKRPSDTEIPKDVREFFYSLSIFSQLLINLTYIGIDNFCSYLSKKPKHTKVEPTEPPEDPPESSAEGSPQPQKPSDH